VAEHPVGTEVVVADVVLGDVAAADPEPWGAELSGGDALPLSSPHPASNPTTRTAAPMRRARRAFTHMSILPAPAAPRRRPGERTTAVRGRST
jgi:hypothetical protein